MRWQRRPLLLLQRWGGERGLAPLIANLPHAESFDAALRATYHVTEGDFELRWQRDVHRVTAGCRGSAAMGFFWLAIGAVLVALLRLRRRRDQAKRQMLDELEIDE